MNPLLVCACDERDIMYMKDLRVQQKHLFMIGWFTFPCEGQPLLSVHHLSPKPKHMMRDSPGPLVASLYEEGFGWRSMGL